MTDNKESYPTIKDFVLQEAYEKAFEKLVIGLKEYEQEKAKIMAQKKDSLHSQFQKKHKDNNAQRRIQKSAKINESRMKKMNARHQNLQQLIVEAERKLSRDICRDEHAYRALLKKLILQGMIRMLEPKVFVRCLQRDRGLIGSLIEECKREFKQLIEKEGIQAEIGEVDLRVDEKYSLQEKNIEKREDRIRKSEESNICFGGVVMTNEDGLIVCKNTLDVRLELAYQHMLPTIRKTLYDQ